MPHPLDDITVWSPDGHAIRLGSLWADRTVVLLFVRHFGCLFCRQQVADVRPWVGAIQAHGADLVVIGNGTIAEARAFRDEQSLEIPLLTDPSRQAYGALNMRRGPGTVLRLSVLLRSLAARLRGFRQSRVAGDPYQQGGLVIIAPGGVELHRFISRTAGDHPPPAEIVAALEAYTRLA